MHNNENIYRQRVILVVLNEEKNTICCVFIMCFFARSNVAVEWSN